MNYEEEIRKIQQKYPLGGIENPMDCAFLIQIEDGMESAESMMRNIKTVKDYETRRYEQYLESKRDLAKSEREVGMFGDMDFTVVKEKGYTFTFKPLPMFNDWNEKHHFVFKVLNKAAENGCSLSKEYIERMNSGSLWEADFVLRNVCFTHSFAKAFWGCGPHKIDSYREIVYMQEWMYHLQQMVLEENSIDYLRKFM